MQGPWGSSAAHCCSTDPGDCPCPQRCRPAPALLVPRSPAASPRHAAVSHGPCFLPALAGAARLLSFLLMLDLQV